MKIFEGSLRTNIEIILRGVEWALFQGADLINLSLGTTNEEHVGRLSSLVSQGGIWVSAAGSYPGLIAGVVAVEIDPNLERDRVRQLGGTRFAASPYPREIPGVPRAKNLQGVSFAVANVTGLLARGVAGDANQWLRQYAVEGMGR